MIEQLADYHIHTSFCNHANGTMKEYVKYAITAGLNEIGFSDHNPLPAIFDSHYRMQPDDLKIYLKTRCYKTCRGEEHRKDEVNNESKKSSCREIIEEIPRV